MSLSLLKNQVISPGFKAQFTGTGGTPPYTYAVLGGGVTGTINPSTGLYTAPLGVTGTDTIQVTDALSATATATVKVYSALMLVCDIIQKELGLADGRVYLWDQKVNQPTDSGLYVAIGVLSCKPFGNNNYNYGGGSGLGSVQSANFLSSLTIDIISRGPEARDRKEEVVMALNSNYAQSQQEINCFYIGKLSSAFVNLSGLDGAAIPYRFQITVNVQYSVTKVTATDYFDDFSEVDVTTEP